jgi:hypothetical protein
MSENAAPGDLAAPTPPPGTLAALLTAPLAASLAEAVSALVGTDYAAQIMRIEPRTHGGAEILVAFVPRPPEITLKLEVGADTVELPLPPGVIDDATPARESLTP